MNISYRSARIHRTPQFDEMIEKKVQAFKRYAQDIESVSIEILGDAHHKKGDVVRVDMTLHLLQAGSAPLRVETAASDLHEALDSAMATMKKNLTAYKDRKSAIQKNLVRTARGKE